MVNRLGKLISIEIQSGIYIGQYYSGNYTSTDLSEFPVFIDFSYASGRHMDGYTLSGITYDGLILYDIGNYIINNPIVDLDLNGRLIVDGVDEI